MRRPVIVYIGAGIALLLLLIMAVPRLPVRVSGETVDVPEDVEGWLAASEARFPDIRPGTEKHILWARGPGRRTDRVLVYFHGFSASRPELSPVMERLSADMEATVFFTRRAGHGRPGAAMGEARAGDWLRDAREALAVARRLGNRIILVGTSTGGTLATWLADDAGPEALEAVVLISPNFGPVDRSSNILRWPLGLEIATLVVGHQLSPESGADHDGPGPDDRAD